MRRRRKSSPFKPLAWLVAAGVMVWGALQAKQIWMEAGGEPAPPSALVAATDDTEASARPPAAVATPARYTIEGLHVDVGILAGEDDPARPPTQARPAPPPAPPLDARYVFDAGLTAEDLYAAGQRLMQAGEAVRARYAFNAALARTRDEALGQALRELLRGLNVPIFLGSAILPDDPGVLLVDLEPGDNFIKVAREYAVTGAFLQSLNPSLNPKRLKPDMGIKVVRGPFHLRVTKHSGRIDLYARDMFVRSFGVDFPEGNSLPSGEYRLSQDGKIIVGVKRWIQFEGLETATESVTSGWIFGAAGPRGSSAKDRSTGLRLEDGDLALLYPILVEEQSHLRVVP